MAGMQAVYYRASDGSEPVDEFISALRDPARQAALDNQIERLNMLRPNDPAEGKAWFRGVTLFGASERLLALGELETAQQFFAEGLELLRSTGDLVNLPIALAAGAALASQLSDSGGREPLGALPKLMKNEHLGRRRPPP